VLGSAPRGISLSATASPRPAFISASPCKSGLGGNDFTELIYQDIAGLKYVYRGSNEVGDMVIELRDGAKLEMRHVPKFQEIYKYIFERCTPEAQESSFAME